MSTYSAPDGGEVAQRSGDSLADVLARELPPEATSLLRRVEQTAEGRPHVYLSHPITTGPKYLSWRRERSASHSAAPDEEELKHQIMSENLRNAVMIRRKLASLMSDRPLIDPTELEMPGWRQGDYHRYWAEVLTRFVDIVVFADGWELSTGCSLEYAVALQLNLLTVDERLTPLGPARAQALLEAAIVELEGADLPSGIAADVALLCSERVGSRLKDDRLAALSAEHNVASFVSFGPGDPALRQQVSSGLTRCPRAASPEAAIAFLFERIGGRSVNVRTFREEPAKSLPFYYGILDPSEAASLVRRCAADGYYCIVNETIDVNDGGVSGVTLGGLAEFSPDDTPRAVERPGTASLPIDVANRVLSTVYGTNIHVPADEGLRVEFSVHPSRVGFRSSHVLVWEVENISPVKLDPDIRWPNRFSSMIGDKAFGLIVADCLGAKVPQTTVVSRRVAPFTFGSKTDSGVWWLRTAPKEQVPGHFTTVDHWVDPFELLQNEDPHKTVAAVLSQEGVEAEFSGATLPRPDGSQLVEGVPGRGDEFMLGRVEPIDLPPTVVQEVQITVRGLQRQLGEVRIEWAFADSAVWVLQVHRVGNPLAEGVMSPGDATDWVEFDPTDGIDALAIIVERAKALGHGVLVTRSVGITSHIGDVLRKAAVPARLKVQTSI